MCDEFRNLGVYFFDVGRASFTDDNKTFVEAYHLSELGTRRSTI